MCSGELLSRWFQRGHGQWRMHCRLLLLHGFSLPKWGVGRRHLCRLADTLRMRAGVRLSGRLVPQAGRDVPRWFLLSWDVKPECPLCRRSRVVLPSRYANECRRSLPAGQLLSWGYNWQRHMQRCVGVLLSGRFRDRGWQHLPRCKLLRRGFHTTRALHGAAWFVLSPGNGQPEWLRVSGGVLL